jgi:hypothetical protein
MVNVVMLAVPLSLFGLSSSVVRCQLPPRKRAPLFSSSFRVLNPPRLLICFLLTRTGAGDGCGRAGPLLQPALHRLQDVDGVAW